MVDQVDGGASSEDRSAWVLPSLTWEAVSRARVRLKGSVADAPVLIGDIEVHSLSRQMMSWWLEARRERAMPEAEDVDPRALLELLPYIRLLLWNENDELIVRVFGSALAAVSGVDLTGRSVFLVDDYPDQVNDMARLKMIHEHPCGLLMHRDYVDPDGAVCRCEFINFPISGARDGMNRIVGTIVPCAPIDESKLRFNVTGEPILHRSLFIDIGFGVPDETGLSV